MTNPKTLSICIPTYNRAYYLKSALLSIYNQTDKLDDFEVVVSDNASTDNTGEVVSEFFKYKNFTYTRQEKNTGYSGNFLNVVNKASGEYCWIVGDDDFILPERIDNIISLLRSSNVDFVYATIKEEPSSLLSKDHTFHTSLLAPTPFHFHEVQKWEELLRPRYSRSFLGDVMGSIFRRSVWLSYMPGGLDQPQLSNLETTYPHSVIFANTFVGKRAIFIESPTVLALTDLREWYAKVESVILVHLNSLLRLYENAGVSNEIMEECWDAFIVQSLPYAVHILFNPEIAHRDNISLESFCKEMASANKELLLSQGKKEIFRYIRKKTGYNRAFLRARIIELFPEMSPVIPETA